MYLREVKEPTPIYATCPNCKAPLKCTTLAGKTVLPPHHLEKPRNSPCVVAFKSVTKTRDTR